MMAANGRASAANDGELEREINRKQKREGERDKPSALLATLSPSGGVGRLLGGAAVGARAVLWRW